MSKQEVKRELNKFIENLIKDYNEQLGCFIKDKDDILEDFEKLIDRLG